MLYYKITKDFRILDKNRKWYPLVENELLTEKEVEKILGVKPQIGGLFERNSVLRNINKNNTYFFFGIRFEAR